MFEQVKEILSRFTKEEITEAYKAAISTAITKPNAIPSASPINASANVITECSMRAGNSSTNAFTT